MSSISQRTAWAAIAATLLWTGACRPSAEQGGQPSSTNGHETGQAADEHEASHDHAEASDVERELAKLSAEDRTSAAAQKTCPVSGEALGAMGVPLKVTVDEQEVWICCEGCESELKSDPAKYLAKLGQAQ